MSSCGFVLCAKKCGATYHLNHVIVVLYGAGVCHVYGVTHWVRSKKNGNAQARVRFSGSAPPNYTRSRKIVRRDLLVYDQKTKIYSMFITYKFSLPASVSFGKFSSPLGKISFVYWTVCRPVCRSERFSPFLGKILALALSRYHIWAVPAGVSFGKIFTTSRQDFSSCPLCAGQCVVRKDFHHLSARF